MSALGQKRTCAVQIRHVRFVPIADIGTLFDHLVGGSEQLRMNFEAKRLGGLEVDHELELDGTRERRWALMNRSAKRFDPPGTVARTLLI